VAIIRLKDNNQMRISLEIRQPRIPADLQCALEKKVQLLRYTRPQTIFYCVDADYRNILVGVFGDGANGAYEWFIWDEDSAALRTSDCGYGNPGVALCSGLVESRAKHANGDHDLVLTWSRQ